MQQHKHKQQWREERDVPFLAGNTVIILSLSAKDENIKVVVHSVLATKYYQASNEFKGVISNQITFSR